MLKSKLSVGSTSYVPTDCPVLKVNVIRTKMQIKSARIHTHPHHSNFFDLHFALAYSIIINRSQKSNSDYIYPNLVARSNIKNDKPSEKNSWTV